MKFIDIVRSQLAALTDQRAAAYADMETATKGAEARTAALTDQSTAEERAAAALLTEDESKAFDAAKAKLDKIDAEIDPVRKQLAELEDIEKRNLAATVVPTSKPIMGNNPAEGRDVRSLSQIEARDAALQILETEGKHLTARQGDNYDKLVRRNSEQMNGDYVARRAIITSTPAYRSAFQKGVMGYKAFTPEEQRALAEFEANEMRAGSHTTTAGGFGVPVLIDPSIILTSGAADAPLLRFCRRETITTDVWKGVSGAAPTWAVVSEGGASSDNFPTLAQPLVTTYTARTFLPFSIEISQDYPSFESEFSPLIAQGYTDYIATKTIVGSGSDIQGVFTALDAVTTSEVTVTTDGALGAVDFRKLYANLPERFRPNATWVFDVTVENVARSLSTNGMGSDFTVDMGSDGITRLMGKPIALTDYAPDFTGTTGAANIAVLMDLRHYVFVQRVGMSVELIPHLFDVTNNMPTGQRGWFAYARQGGNVVASNAGRILQNT